MKIEKINFLYDYVFRGSFLYTLHHFYSISFSFCRLHYMAKAVKDEITDTYHLCLEYELNMWVLIRIRSVFDGFSYQKWGMLCIDFYVILNSIIFFFCFDLCIMSAYFPCQPKISIEEYKVGKYTKNNKMEAKEKQKPGTCKGERKHSTNQKGENGERKMTRREQRVNKRKKKKKISVGTCYVRINETFDTLIERISFVSVLMRLLFVAVGCRCHSM